MRVRAETRRHRLGEALIADALVSPEDLQRAMRLQADFGHRLGTNLLELALVSERDLLNALGRLRQVQTADAEALASISPEVLRLVPAKLALRYQIVPVRRSGGSLLIASMDPGDPLLEDEIGSLTSCLTRTVMALEVRLHAALAAHYGGDVPVRLAALAKRLEREDLTPPEPPPPEADVEGSTSAVDGDGDGDVDGDGETTGSSAEPPRRRRRRAGPPPRFIELDDDSRSRIYPPERQADLSPEARLERVSEALVKAEIRDEIADQLLSFCAPYFRRRLLLVRRQGRILGWRGEGPGISLVGLRAIDVPAEEPSLFRNLAQAGNDLWRGPLPPFPAHKSLELGLGSAPRTCVVVPIVVRDRIACYLYGDNAAAGVAGVPVDALRRLARKAGTALEVIILKNRIRSF